MPKNYPYSDVLFDYAEFLRQADTAGSIAKNPRTDRKVVILGGGASAICIAYELLRTGVKIVAIIVPEDEKPQFRAGRCFSYQFEGNEKFLAEMGILTSPDATEKEMRMRRLVEDVYHINEEFAKYLVPIDNDYEKNTVFIDWTNEQNYRGAFKLDQPGQGSKTQNIFLDYLKKGDTDDDSRVFIAGVILLLIIRCLVEHL